jgi:hypothetical protein
MNGRLHDENQGPADGSMRGVSTPVKYLGSTSRVGSKARVVKPAVDSASGDRFAELDTNKSLSSTVACQ